MCGIWSFISTDSEIKKNKVKEIVSQLVVLSETRGKEASGMAGFTGKGIEVYKAAMPGSQLIKTSEFKEYEEAVFDRNIDDAIALIGHSRLVTNGSQNDGDNNQPVCGDQVVTVHNGIIVNVEQLWTQHGELTRKNEVDTEIFTSLLEKYMAQGERIDAAIEHVYSEIQGMASTLTFLLKEKVLIAASNNGSLYFCRSKNCKSVLFASERLILHKLINRCKLSNLFLEDDIEQISAKEVVYVDIKTSEIRKNVLGKGINFKTDLQEHEKHAIRSRYAKNDQTGANESMVNILDEKKLIQYDIDIEPIKKIRRCTKCILPETMPFIEFDSDGVCNYCRTYKKQNYLGKEKLHSWAETLPKKQDGLDSVVAFSGGRDSSYGLHYFVKELGLKPVAYSYDWGMVTDLARRNQSRMCEKLGIELVVVSADIKKKRENIRKNVNAWLRKPDIGMIPLFMAGDKHYFYYANKVKKDFGLDTVLLASNPFEKTYFKSGYCGVKPEILRLGEEKRAMERLPLESIIRMAGHYLRQYVGNPLYINKSLLDTISATLSYYVIPHDYFLLFDYIPWDEKVVNEVLINEYDWETSKDTKSTWRIGDGTSPFYNYVYYLVTGFSENDTLRSNQIREGMLTREEALELAYQDNRPRFDSIKWYFDTIGISMYDALERVNQIPRLY